MAGAVLQPDGAAALSTTLELGRTNEQQVARLQQATLIPVEVMLGSDQQSSAFQKDESFGLFHDESWAMVHYLLWGPARPAEGGAGFLHGLKRGTSLKQALAPLSLGVGALSGLGGRPGSEDYFEGIRGANPNRVVRCRRMARQCFPQVFENHNRGRGRRGQDRTGRPGMLTRTQQKAASHLLIHALSEVGNSGIIDGNDDGAAQRAAEKRHNPFG